MSAQHPPRLAMCLLTRLAAGPHHESLVGDLVEQFEHGHSRMWFWRQTLAAVAASVAIDLRRHKWPATRALIAGWAAMLLGGLVATSLTRATRGPLLAFLSANGSSGDALVFWSFNVPGIVFSYAACAMCGWLIARLHRRAPSAVLVFAATVFLVEYGVAAWMLAHPPLGHELTLREWVLLPALIGRPFALLAGCLAGATAPEQSPPVAT